MAANLLPGGYADGTLTVLPPSKLGYSMTGSTLFLFWPDSYVGYELESATSLPAADWTPVQSSATAGQHTAQIPIEGTIRFFRLKRP